MRRKNKIYLKKTKTFLFVISMIFTFSCATQHINYDRNKILKEYSKDYKVFVDSEQVDFENIYLNKENIKSVQLNKQKQELKIAQIKPVKFVNLNSFTNDSLSSKRKIDLIVIDGIPIADSLKEKTKIDINSIKEIIILNQDKVNELSSCRYHNGDLLLINTK